MAEYVIENFLGIAQDLTENKLPPGYTADCANMDTENGDLTVGRGYVKHIETPVPGTGDIWRMYHWHTLQNNLFLVAAGDSLYAWDGDEWNKIFDYTTILPANTHITATKWDFVECRLGSTDYLLIANGQTQIVKWAGGNTAEAFGTGEFIFESTVDSVEYNATKAESASYSEANMVGTFTLTMPTGWAYSQGCRIAWKVPADTGNITECKVVIGADTYTLEYVPILASGDMVVVTLTSTTEGTAGDEWTEKKYGIDKITLTAALDDDQKTRCLAVGIYVDGITYEVDEIDVTQKILTLKEICTKELTHGMDAKVRGGISNIPVNYLEIFVSRLFSAGDPSHPSRLYWSQPPGDTRTIEDWSMDEASDQTGGGFVEVGTTSSDPIVGLCSLSSQLIIYKESSVYRLLGDRPTNFRIVQVNRDIERTVNTAIIANGDVPYWLTKAGMYYHDGQQAHLTPTARQIHTILENVSLATTKSCENLDRLYFTCRAASEGKDDTIIVYDLRDRTYLLRNGFEVIDICAYDGNLYSINSNRYVYRWDRNAKTYDGGRIDAYWNTPFTDLQAKTVVKAPYYIYLRGEGEIVKIDLAIGKQKQHRTYQIPIETGDVLKIPLTKDEGRVFGMKIYNQFGGWFKVMGGMELVYETREDGNV